MPSRRDQIKLDDDELHAFLEAQRIVTCATTGPNGRPHLMPLWYVHEGVVLKGWTFAKSQKARNLERDPRATLQIEDGVEYHALRGVMFECDVTLERDPERIILGDLGSSLWAVVGALQDVRRADLALRVGQRTFRPFGGANSCRPPTSLTCRRTCTTPRRKSTSSTASPKTSPCRSPQPAASVAIAW